MVRLEFVFKADGWSFVQVIGRTTREASRVDATGLAAYRRMTVCGTESAMRIHFEAKFILGALLASLSTAPAVLAQSQSQTSSQDSSQAATPAKSQGQSDAASALSSTTSSAASQAKTQNASGNEPQMQSQEARHRNRLARRREGRER